MLRAYAPALRQIGRTLDRLGVSLQGDAAYVERLVPNVQKVALKAAQPKVADSVRLAPNASLIGGVSIGEGSSVWYSSIVRAEGSEVVIGANVSIGDGATVLATAKSPAKVGDSANIGPGATLTGCSVGPKAVVGAGAIVLEGVAVGETAIVAPGSIVPAGTSIGAGELWAGAPAVKVRDVTLAESQMHEVLREASVNLGAAHGAEWAKTPQQLVAEETAHEVDEMRDEDFEQFDDTSDLETDRRGILFNQLR